MWTLWGWNDFATCLLSVLSRMQSHARIVRLRNNSVRTYLVVNKHTLDVSNGKEGLQAMTLQGLHGLYTATGIYIQGSVG